VPDLSAEHHPGAAADQLWQRAPATALRGLRAGAADMVEATQDLDAASLAELEGRLERAGAPSLASMTDRRTHEMFAIMHRGRIRNDDEARLVNGVVSNLDHTVSSQLARELLAEYELRAKPAY
jgi:hypothetical protein